LRLCVEMNDPMESYPDPGTARWRILGACIVAMLAVANLQYAWTLFTTPITRNLHATLAAVQWAFTFFVLGQT